MNQYGITFPKSWRVVPLRDVVSKAGVFSDGDWVESKDQDPDGDVRLVQLADVGDGRYINKSSRYLTSTKAKELRCTFLENGDVLIARMPDPLGRACIFPGDERPCVTVVDVCVLRTATPRVSHSWVMHAVNAPQFRVEVAKLQAGSTRKRISRSNLGGLEVPVPPDKEQQALVDEIEKHLSRIDAGVAALERVQANLKRYRASVLKAACEGRLVPTEAELARQEGRDYEPASVLLKRILVERRRRWEQAELAKLKAKGKPPQGDGWKKKYEEPKPPDTSDLPELPEGWCWATVGAVCSHIVDCLHRTPEYTDQGYPAIRTADVIPGRLLLGQARRVDEGTYREQVSRLEPRPGDVLYTREGERYGLAAVVPEGAELCISQRMMHFRVTAPMLPSFFMWAMNSPGVYAQATRDVGGSTSPHVNIASVREFCLPIPPVAEQGRIAAAVDDFFSLADNADGVLERDFLRASALRQAILRDAFSGRLVRGE